MSIAALFSDSQARLFRWLFGQPERSYHLSELGSASQQCELNRLVDAGPRNVLVKFSLAVAEAVHCWRVVKCRSFGRVG